MDIRGTYKDWEDIIELSSGELKRKLMNLATAEWLTIENHPQAQFEIKGENI